MKTTFSVRSLLLAVAVITMSAASFGQLSISVAFAPPAIPVYEQPVCPGDGYLWTPGYWAYDDEIDDYYWVPGTWVVAPEVGLLWTPGYWGWGGESFVFHDGYWGPHVGYYGGIFYDFGYFGVGYEGGYWEGERFFYNRAVNRVDVTVVHNVYNKTVINNTTNVTRVSYNGGNGGVDRRPTPEEQAVGNERHIPPVSAQTQHVQAARSNPQLRASANQGRPPIAATARPGALSGSGVVPAKEAGAPYHPPANHGGPRGTQPAQPVNNRPENANPENAHPGNAVPATGSRPAAVVHPRDLPPPERAAAPNTGNPKLDQKYQQQQQKLSAQQENERQKLQQKQDQEHQRIAQQQGNQARMQQLEQKHQQQTQQLQQRHADQQQQLQQRTQPARPPEPRPKG